jgi:GT2 family glycosyltransferase
MSERQQPLLTVVVCTYNRTDLLPSCLQGLAAQTIRDQIQVVVVDDGSSQDVAEIVAPFDVDFIVLGRNRGLSYARNAGIAQAHAPIIAFTDDDVTVPPEWCEQLLDAWTDAPPGTAAIGGEVNVADISSRTQRYLARHNPLAPIDLSIAPEASFLERLRFYLQSDSTASLPVRPVYSLVGANMSFTGEALTEIGGFDPSIRFGGDEEYVCKRLRQRYGNDSILCYASIVVAHKFDARLRDTLRRAFHYGVANGRTWSREGGVPSVRPTGGLFLVVFVVGAPISVLGAALFALCIPFVMWRRWVRSSWRERNLEAFTDPLIALAQELCANAGFIVGWRSEHRRNERPNGSDVSTDVADQ